MKLRVLTTTDGKFVGNEINLIDNRVVLSEDEIMNVEKILEIPEGVRLVSSSYVIDSEKLDG